MNVTITGGASTIARELAGYLREAEVHLRKAEVHLPVARHALGPQSGHPAPGTRAAEVPLAGSGRIRLVAPELPPTVPAGVEALAGDLRDPEFAKRALEGSEALVHLDPLESGGSELERLDRATRGTFTTMQVAADAGIRRVVLGSTLALFDQVPSSWRISEWWKPRPTPAIDQLAPWLAELSA